MEKRIICPVCNAEKMCIEESQGDLISYMCFRCGYMSDSRMVDESEFMEKHLKNTPQIIKDLKQYDIERSIYWYPSVVNVPEKGVVYPKEDPETFQDTYCWVAAKYIKSERKGYDFELDMDNSREFNYVLFYEALRYIEVIIEGKGNESNYALA